VILTHNSTPTDAKAARRAGRRDILHVLVVIALIAVVAGLALDNRQDVSVGWLAGDTTMPLYQLFVATFVLGILAGFLLRARRRHHRSH